MTDKTPKGAKPAPAQDQKKAPKPEAPVFRDYASI